MTYGPQEKLPEAMRASNKLPLFSLLGVALCASLLLFAGCTSFIAARDKEIKEATRSIESAHDDAQRAKAYSARGAAYSEEARYGRIMKRISNDEYERLFHLALNDHNQAIVLNPANPEVYFNRAQMYYDRGTLDLLEQKSGRKTWLDQAAADFEKVTKMDPHNDLAFDRLGLTYEQNDEDDKAIEAYTNEMALNSLGKRRLATAYCDMGFNRQQKKDFAGAVVAYQKSLEFGTADDKSCRSEPLNAIILIYTYETHEYDKAWDTVHWALKQGRAVSPELIAKLVKASGRTN